MAKKWEFGKLVKKNYNVKLKCATDYNRWGVQYTFSVSIFDAFL